MIVIGLKATMPSQLSLADVFVLHAIKSTFCDADSLIWQNGNLSQRCVVHCVVASVAERYLAAMRIHLSLVDNVVGHAIKR